MKNMKLPEDLQLRIIDYLIYTRATLDHKSEYKKFEKMLSPSLLTEVNYNLYEQIVKLNDLFNQDPEVKAFIIARLRNKFAKPEEDIIIQGSLGTSIYFLAKGDCEVLVKDYDDKERFVAVLKPGSHFGEISLIYNIPRTATV